ncbi:mechanosensitive ion channel family protein [Rhodoferax antarcticus]|uniref:Small-conductance mechanosensitive channel n=1 Tax=Rhodoferax antarcticus ANT.BR TaxID=1111071 RepID=A0A1Q8YC34_9BURK|nr:mechanosensitive ion channel domain-containing protein [Rhodoferax antarcticus]APW46701.1 mechanosensitive ion channel protein MscS [Rhodoferax antarcticus]MCW2313007.1 small-conductance mechanosensitive channel [Rhodoferax antarcticus]OLP05608.1 mechanosensitive ion channel family protein [Rhodoferax antarcticus ANT.BR]
MAAAELGQQKAAKLINDLQDISFTKIGLILLVTWLVILLARRLLPYLAERGPSQLRLYLLGAVPTIRLVLLVIATTWVIPIVFNITLQNFLVIAGALGVAIGFAFKDYVSSLIAGFVAIFERPYRPGDWVRIGDDYGEVRTVGMRAIEICTPADDIVHVPHEKIWQNNIANSNDGTRTLMCVASFYLRPNHDAGRVRVALRDVALSSAYLEYDKPVVVMLADTPLGTHYKLKAYPFDMRDQFHFISDLTIRGKLAIADSGAAEVQAMPGVVEPRAA